jgi:hypothetical protein
VYWLRPSLPRLAGGLPPGLRVIVLEREEGGVSALVLLLPYALEGDRLGVGGGESDYSLISTETVRNSGAPSTRLLSDRAFLLLAASARMAACCSFI